MSTHKPCPTKTLDPALVQMVLESASSKAVTVSFYKTDGDLRTYNGLPKVHIRRVNNERGQKQAADMKKRGQFWIDFPHEKDNKKGFSFFLDRVAGIKANGEIHGVVAAMTE